jgi:hypothetical protein
MKCAFVGFHDGDYFCTVAPNIFSIITAILYIQKRVLFSPGNYRSGSYLTKAD